MKDAHLLNADYFTIHASRERDQSRGSSADRSTTHHTSMIGHYQSDSEREENIGDVSDILKLMTVLRKARVDREKISAVGAFLVQAGDDLLYLGDNMAEIMNLLIYHTSRLQLQSNLFKSLEDARNGQKKDNHAAGETDDKEKEPSAKRINNLRKAVRAADEHVEDDHRPNERRDLQENDANGEAANSGSDEAGREGIAGEEGRVSESIKDEIWGIPEKAETSEDGGNQWGNGREDQQSTTTPAVQEKIKSKEH